MVLKWGIVSAGKISNHFAKAILSTSRNEHEIIAIAARDKERAKEFASTYEIPKYYSDYLSLAEDKDVDIVYVGTIHPKHLEVSKLMLEYGKHVLCEKPMTMNEKQTKELIEYASNKKLFLMEAIWSRCFPVYEELRKLFDSNSIGDIFYVNITFGRKLNQVERINLKELGGGVILDLGVYALQFQQFVFKDLKPLHMVATGHKNKWETDESASAITTYPEGKTAVISISACTEYPNEVLIVGSKGTIKVPLFWRPTTIIINDEPVHFELPNTKYDDYRPAGLSYEVTEVGKCIAQGLLESPKITLNESLELAQLMDKFRKGVGVVYAEDSLDVTELGP